MKNILIILAAVAALSSCVEHTRRVSSPPTKKVRAKLTVRLADRIIISRNTSIIEVDTMYQVDDTLLHNNSMYVIVK